MPTPEEWRRRGFVRGADGKLRRTDESNREAIRSGSGTEDLAVQETGRKIYVSHNDLVDHAASMLEASPQTHGDYSLEGFWDYVKELAENAKMRGTYTGEMERPEKWTDSYIERWLNHNILEIWRRTHQLKSQLTLEQFKQTFKMSEYKFARRKLKPSQTAKSEGTMRRKGPQGTIKKPLTRKQELKRIRNLGFKKNAKAVAGGAKKAAERWKKRTTPWVNPQAPGSGYKQIKKVAKVASRIARRRFSDDIHNYAKDKELHPYIVKKQKRRSKKKQGAYAATGAAGGVALSTKRGRKALMTPSVRKNIRKAGRAAKGAAAAAYWTSKHFREDPLGKQKGQRSRKRLILEGALGATLTLAGGRKLGKLAKKRRRSGVTGGRKWIAGKGGAAPPKRLKAKFSTDNADKLHEYFLGVAGVAASAVGGAVGGMMKKKKKKKQPWEQNSG